MAQGFRDRTKREDERFRLATDSEYWFAVCFKTRTDKEAFLAAARRLLTRRAAGPARGRSSGT